MHTFTEHSTNDYFQIRASHDLPQFNVKEGDLGGYVQKNPEFSDNKVMNVTRDSWVAKDCYVDNESFITCSLIDGGSSIKSSDIFESTIINSTVQDSDSEYSTIISAYLDQNCHITRSEVSDVSLRAVLAGYSILSPDNPYGFIRNVAMTEARITSLEQYTSVSRIGTERQTATLYPHKDTGKPTVRIGCWYGALEDLPMEVTRRLEYYVLVGNPKEQGDIHAKEYQAFQTYAETYAEMFINN